MAIPDSQKYPLNHFLVNNKEDNIVCPSSKMFVMFSFSYRIAQVPIVEKSQITYSKILNIKYIERLYEMSS